MLPKTSLLPLSACPCCVPSQLASCLLCMLPPAAAPTATACSAASRGGTPPTAAAAGPSRGQSADGERAME